MLLFDINHEITCATLVEINCATLVEINCIITDYYCIILEQKYKK